MVILESISLRSKTALFHIGHSNVIEMVLKGRVHLRSKSSTDAFFHVQQGKIFLRLKDVGDWKISIFLCFFKSEPM